MATLNHELNNPLTISLLNLELLKSKKQDPNDLKSLDTAIGALNRIKIFLQEVRNIKNFEENHYSKDQTIFKIKK